MSNVRPNETTASTKQFVSTTFGRIAYAEAGEGFPTLFIHGLAHISGATNCTPCRTSAVASPWTSWRTARQRRTPVRT